MTGYSVRRILSIIPVLLVVELVAFSLIHIVPGDPVSVMLGAEEARLEDMQRVRKELGLDRPIWEQGLSWFVGSLRGDLGTTLFQPRPVTQ
ncbi:MAG: ABC transporter permease, partial [Chloroflexi bacterium]|nr:ABC transporter permease [Chloroflexota bacterium]